MSIVKDELCSETTSLSCCININKNESKHHNRSVLLQSKASVFHQKNLYYCVMWFSLSLVTTCSAQCPFIALCLSSHMSRISGSAWSFTEPAALPVRSYAIHLPVIQMTSSMAKIILTRSKPSPPWEAIFVLSFRTVNDRMMLSPLGIRSQNGNLAVSSYVFLIEF